MDRWFRQFEEPRDKINAKTEDVTVGKHKVTYVSAEGTYKSGMPGGPQTPMPNYALVGAITVPAFTTNTTTDHRHVLSHSGARGVIVSSRTRKRSPGTGTLLYSS